MSPPERRASFEPFLHDLPPLQHRQQFRWRPRPAPSPKDIWQYCRKGKMRPSPMQPPSAKNNTFHTHKENRAKASKATANPEPEEQTKAQREKNKSNARKQSQLGTEIYLSIQTAFTAHQKSTYQSRRVCHLVKMSCRIKIIRKRPLRTRKGPQRVHLIPRQSCTRNRTRHLTAHVQSSISLAGSSQPEWQVDLATNLHGGAKQQPAPQRGASSSYCS